VLQLLLLHKAENKPKFPHQKIESCSWPFGSLQDQVQEQFRSDGLQASCEAGHHAQTGATWPDARIFVIICRHPRLVLVLLSALRDCNVIPSRDHGECSGAFDV